MPHISMYIRADNDPKIIIKHPRHSLGRIECIDLLPELKTRQSASAAPFYFQTDRHLTPEGNAVIAEILTPMLADVLARNESSTTQP